MWDLYKETLEQCQALHSMLPKSAYTAGLCQNWVALSMAMAVSAWHANGTIWSPSQKLSDSDMDLLKDIFLWNGPNMQLANLCYILEILHLYFAY